MLGSWLVADLGSSSMLCTHLNLKINRHVVSRTGVTHSSAGTSLIYVQPQTLLISSIIYLPIIYTVPGV